MGNAVLRNIVSGNTVSGNKVSGNTVSENTVPVNMVSGNTAQRGGAKKWPTIFVLEWSNSAKKLIHKYFRPKLF